MFVAERRNISTQHPFVRLRVDPFSRKAHHVLPRTINDRLVDDEEFSVVHLLDHLGGSALRFIKDNQHILVSRHRRCCLHLSKGKTHIDPFAKQTFGGRSLLVNRSIALLISGKDISVLPS